MTMEAMHRWPYSDTKQPAPNTAPCHHDGSYSQKLKPSMSTVGNYSSSCHHDSSPGSAKDGLSSRKSHIVTTKDSPYSPRKQQDTKPRLSVPSTFAVLTTDRSLSPPAPPVVRGTYEPIGFRCRANNGIATKQPVVPRVSKMATQFADNGQSNRVWHPPPAATATTTSEPKATTKPRAMSMATSNLTPTESSNAIRRNRNLLAASKASSDRHISYSTPFPTATNNPKRFVRRLTDVGFISASRAPIHEFPNQRSASFTDDIAADPKTTKGAGNGHPLHKRYISIAGQSRHIPRPIRSGRFCESPNIQNDDNVPPSSTVALSDFIRFPNDDIVSALHRQSIGPDKGLPVVVGPLDTHNDVFVHKEKASSCEDWTTFAVDKNCETEANSGIPNNANAGETNINDYIDMVGVVLPSDSTYVDHYIQ